ncbi:MAG: hypothetical protein R3B72_45760 [Polyangiaceae bacterium]
MTTDSEAAPLSLAPRIPAPKGAPTPTFVARWDLDKTYLRTDFDTMRDLLRTAVERPDQKRTVPGAATLMRELSDAGAEIHILSGSPEQLRSRIVEKLRLDGVRFQTLTLKPNLQNLLRLRFRAIRGQLGYKLPTLLMRRAELPTQRTDDGELLAEALFGDDAEADAFVYSLYADVCQGAVDGAELAEVMRLGDCYPDDIERALHYVSYIVPGPAVERILIHLERQTSPADFDGYGGRVVPFYNYLQAAFVLHEDGRLGARQVLRVAQDLALRHHFDGGSLARSYLDLARRGHVAGASIPGLVATYAEWLAQGRVAGASDLSEMVRELEEHGPELPPRPSRPAPSLDYPRMVRDHNRRRR